MAGGVGDSRTMHHRAAEEGTRGAALQAAAPTAEAAVTKPGFQKQVLAAFDAALDQPDESRRAWLEENWPEEVAAAVSDLLRADLRSAVLSTRPPEPLALSAAPPPERIGPYRIVGSIGSGGMGEVFLGRRDDGLFDQEVAIKLPRPSVLHGASYELFAAERRLLARLQHPDIARLYDGGVEPEGRPYFVMERLHGPLIDVHVREQALDPRAIVALLLIVCEAAGYAHGKLIVHADIKPSNVIVENGRPKLLDFGVAQVMEEARGDPPALVGLSSAYASPQRRRGEPAGPADDVYSLGALLLELLAGRPPEQDEPPSVREVVLKNAALGPLQTRRRRARQIGGDLEAIVAKATAAETPSRYSSAEALANDLRRWLAARTIHARLGEPAWRRLLRPAASACAAVVYPAAGKATAGWPRALDRLGSALRGRISEAHPSSIRSPAG